MKNVIVPSRINICFKHLDLPNKFSCYAIPHYEVGIIRSFYVCWFYLVVPYISHLLWSFGAGDALFVCSGYEYILTAALPLAMAVALAPALALGRKFRLR